MMLVILLCVAAVSAEERTVVKFSPKERKQLLANMREHLSALAESQRLAEAGHWQQAADLVEQRLGISALDSDGADHLMPLMPEKMREMGREMHETASHLASRLRENKLDAVFSAYGDLLEQCNSCHQRYRVR